MTMSGCSNRQLALDIFVGNDMTGFTHNSTWSSFMISIKLLEEGIKRYDEVRYLFFLSGVCFSVSLLFYDRLLYVFHSFFLPISLTTYTIIYLQFIHFFSLLSLSLSLSLSHSPSPSFRPLPFILL